MSSPVTVAAIQMCATDDAGANAGDEPDEGRTTGQRSGDGYSRDQVRPDRLLGQERIPETRCRAVFGRRAVVVLLPDEQALHEAAVTRDAAAMYGALLP